MTVMLDIYKKNAECSHAQPPFDNSNACCCHCTGCMEYICAPEKIGQWKQSAVELGSSQLPVLWSDRPFLCFLKIASTELPTKPQ